MVVSEITLSEWVARRKYKNKATTEATITRKDSEEFPNLLINEASQPYFNLYVS